jgi:hypothetical protein
MGKKIGLAVIAVLLVLAVVIALQPGEFRIERSAVMKAPSDIVFAQINNLHNWQNWSPWEGLDPNLKRTYSGPESGAGAQYAWEGNDDVGAGRMTITESKPGAHVGIRLEFLKPFEATNQTDFNLLPAEDGTQVTWAMRGENNFVSKAFGLVMNMDAMIGKDFEKGLASLKKVSETEAIRQAEETANIAAADDATAPTAAAVESRERKAD